MFVMFRDINIVDIVPLANAEAFLKDGLNSLKSDNSH